MSIPKQDERTPGPWRVRQDIELDAAEIVDAGGYIIAICDGDNTTVAEDKANAEFIVSACNAYGSTDALRSALADRDVIIGKMADALDIADHILAVQMVTDVPAKWHRAFRAAAEARAALSAGATISNKEIVRSGSPAPSTEGLREWQPIETAKKDGTHIIGLTQFGAREIWWHRDFYEGEFWQDEGDSEPEPTHWVPMPVKARTALAGVTAPETTTDKGGI